MTSSAFTTRFLNDGTNPYVSLTQDNKCVLIDIAEYEQFINKGLAWIEGNQFPFMLIDNENYLCIREHILSPYYDDPTVTITYVNGNERDLRRSNIHINKWLETDLLQTYGRADFICSHNPTYNSKGKRKRNATYQVGTDMFIMFAEPKTLVVLDKAALDIIYLQEKKLGRKMTWFITNQGYVASNHPFKSGVWFMHRLVMEYDEPLTTGYSIDHINRIRHDNRLSNLRIASHYEQSMNRKGVVPGTKYERKHNAQPLPAGITQDMLIKYIGYYTEEYKTKSGIKTREFFRIETHPNQCGREFNSSKSNKVSIFEKLEEAKRIVAELDKRVVTDVSDVKPKQEAEEGYVLPQYFHLVKQHGKDAVCFERRYDNGKRRVGIKVTIKEGESIKQIVERIMEQVDIETGDKKEKSPKQTESGFVLPKGFCLIHDKKSDKQCLSFQRNVGGKRYVGRTFIGEGETHEDTFARLKTIILNRYEMTEDEAKQSIFA